MSTGDLPAVNRTRLCESLVESSQDAFVVLTHDGTIEFASGAIKRLLGYEPSQVVGRNVVDLLRGDDIERALLQLGVTLSHLARGVTRFAVEAADGRYVPIEVSATAVTDGTRELIGLHARDGRDQAFIEQVMAALLGGASRHEALVPVVNAIGWERMHSIVAIEWVDEGGRQQVASGGFDEGLGGSEATADDPDADPWSRCRLTRTAQQGAVSDEAGWLASLAEDAGVDAYWVEPVVWSPAQPPATVTVWTTPEYSTDVHTYGMTVAKSLVELILRWTEHVPGRT